MTDDSCSLFLCSHFSSVAPLLAEQVAGKKVLFIPTASIHEGYTGYVGSARKAWSKLGAEVVELELTQATDDQIRDCFENVDVVYFTGGNSFFLIDQIRQRHVDQLIQEKLTAGAMYVGESAGAIVAAP
ncbi:Type 1 glutamine amidotransferase-like domain-containing protein, partial [Trueperella pyogenes]